MSTEIKEKFIKEKGYSSFNPMLNNEWSNFLLDMLQCKEKEIEQLKQKLKESEDRNKLTTKLLRDLLEFQNGAPLIQYKDEFEKTESECWDIVNKNENNL